MLKKTLLLFIVSAAINNIFAQKPEEIVFTVDGENVTVEEFKYIYEKNNSINKDENLYSKTSLDEYLDLYTKFKLKVHEAKSLGLDTTEKFKREFETYRNQLAQPYLHDKEVSEKLVEEAYERMKWELRASHILIDVAEDAYPSDTMKAYNLAMEAYNRAKAGEDFAKVAGDFAQYTKDPTLKERGGDLGYFTVFNMIYPFENACYNAKVNEVVGPVRTRFGYHVIKLTDKRPYQGEMTAAHIMIRTDLGTEEEQEVMAKNKIDSIYNRLLKGEKFEDLARTESQHYTSAQQGGRLRPFNALATWLPTEIIDEAYALKEDGDFSKPFKTEYGWHIVKRLHLEPLKSYDDMKEFLKKRVERDTRSQRSTKAALRRIKEENRFKEYKKGINAFKTEYDTLLLDGNWVPNPEVDYNRKMFMIGKSKFYQYDFAKYLEANQKKNQFKNAAYAADYLYDKFVEETVFNYEDSRLELKYPEFKNIVREYYEGILLFEITDNEVWTKAMKDTVGQREFYNNNVNNYQWKKRADVLIFYCQDKTVADKIKAELAADNSNVNELVKTLNANNSMAFSYTKDLYEEGQEELLNEVDWKQGFAVVPDYKGRYVLIKFNEILPARAKKLREIKGLVIADYQDYLEKNWLAKLKQKYKVVVNQSVVDSMVKS
ncbi:hypothetical protein GC194_11460 [bacterium]|nr:hypothetical protein [bacterium]